MRLVKFAKHLLQQAIKLGVGFNPGDLWLVLLADFLPINPSQSRVEMFVLTVCQTMSKVRRQISDELSFFQEPEQRRQPLADELDSVPKSSLPVSGRASPQG